ncbi:MAG: TRAP transporter large permease [Deltaproteobacteria bacterium]|jgi:TRAP-type transport system large permease protein|nr:TRAP transporter large permease [Deltaproteobacteria bacterium]MBT4643420.1 TRAP transporter large permease [Deltaproteobacteria bacterium]MBT6499540.1 TRAP transporter large permease [Deltaproteobacteria bacterium]MBT6612894.1 TRAP transporter large permease [Deltaproteobacteria bacterium]MBT7153664.1 TRAP transporter large permease [Deltaproteobacteria bacterium]
MLTVLLIFFIFIFLGLPIGVTLGVAGVAGLIQIGGENFLTMAPKRFFEGLDLFTFMAMPFFILAGEIMNKSGITSKLADFADALVGHLRGGLAHSNMIASVLFAGMTGAAVADTAAFGNTLVPAMVKEGYDRPFSCAVTVAGSIIGPTIPPSNLMVIYGSLMGVSIAGLFAAGILPGLLICVLCMAVIALLGKRLNLPKSERGFSLLRIFWAFKSSFLAILMPGIILGGILFGIVTPTEAAAIAVFYALFISVVIYRSITFKDIVEMLIRTSRITGIVFLIIASASILSWWMTFMQIPQKIAAFFLFLSSDPKVIIALILLLLLAVGMFMDINAALIILAPVLGPLTMTIGMDPVHAGIMIVLALNISLMTPPVGACLFVMSSVTGEKIERISVSLIPFLIVEVFILFLVAFWDKMTLFIPRLIM